MTVLHILAWELFHMAPFSWAVGFWCGVIVAVLWDTFWEGM